MPDIAPRAAVAFDLGLAAHRQGDFATALARFSEAYEAAPDWPDAGTALAHTHERLGEIDAAYRIGFACARLGAPSETLITVLTGLLDNYPPPNWLTAEDFAPVLKIAGRDTRLFARAALSALVREPPLRDALTIAQAQGFAAAADWALSPAGRALIENETLLRALRAGPNSEPALELLLTAIWQRVNDDPALATLAVTLAAQCALNEYVWAPQADRHAATSIGFNDPTSRAVARQYEDHPYPAWHHVDLPPAGSQHAQLRSLQRKHGLAETPEHPRVLIAGCGTGQQVVQMATTLGPHARIVACDLSAASLAYAQRKATEHGIDGVEFRQADILDLATWTERFDIVACTGVLHHMQDPRRGWRILTDLTLPGGAQYIALYSALARTGLDDIRRRFPPDASLPIDARIRDFRRRVLEAHAFDWQASGLTWTDFFTMGGCRDLLFHAHEDRYTIARLAEDLNVLGLQFLDFNLPSSAARDFADARDDLTAWDAYERAHPNTFTRMYQFWCAKPA